MDNDWGSYAIVYLLAALFAQWVISITIVPPKRTKGGKYISFGKYYPGSEDEQKLKEWAGALSPKAMHITLAALAAAWLIVGLSIGRAIWAN